ncbi:MAG: sulfatase [Candidatus Hydrogenedentota bacterium]
MRNHSHFRAICTVGFSILLLTFSGCERAVTPSSGGEPRKIIMIVIDSLRYDHLDAFGYRKETAPFISELVDSSVVFDLAVSPSNFTGVSVPAYFTGKPYSNIFPVHPRPVWIPETEQTLAETLRDAGYETHMWTANGHLVHKGFDQGFSHVFSQYLQNTATSLLSIDGLIREIDSSYVDTNGPEFHYIHTMDVHFPYHPPHPYERLFKPKSMLDYPGGAAGTGAPRDHFGELIWSDLPYYSQNNTLNDVDILHLIDLYDGTILYTDDHLPELLESLNYDPDLDMLIITADHGEQLFSHGWAAHSALLLMQEIHVPLLIRFARYQPHTVSGPVSLMDLYPTLCDILGLEQPAGIVGSSLSTALEGTSEGGVAAYSESYHHLGPGASLVTEDRLYYFRANQSELYPWRLWPILTELYDISEDPACRYNLLEYSQEQAEPYHMQLVTDFPQWSSYSWELMHASEADPKLGANELEGWRMRHVERGELALDPLELAQTGAMLDEVRPELVARATVSDPGSPYALSFTYKVESGMSRFELFDVDTDEELWSYDVTKLSPDNISLTVRVDIPGNRVRFRAEALENGRTKLIGLQLRRLYIPEIEALAAQGAYENLGDVESDILTETEKNALEAIGYLR